MQAPAGTSQALPHVLQLLSSKRGSTHLPLQSILPIEQPHCPPMHRTPGAHRWPHVPQFSASW